MLLNSSDYGEDFDMCYMTGKMNIWFSKPAIEFAKSIDANRAVFIFRLITEM